MEKRVGYFSVPLDQKERAKKILTETGLKPGPTLEIINYSPGNDGILQQTERGWLFFGPAEPQIIDKTIKNLQDANIIPLGALDGIFSSRTLSTVQIEPD